jgi:hypothetical protein
MKGDLYPLGGYSLLECVCFSIKPAQEDKSLWTIKFCSYHSIKLLDVECCKSIFWIMDLLQESTESLEGKDQVSYSLAGNSRWQVEISISGFNFIAQVFFKMFLK